MFTKFMKYGSICVILVAFTIPTIEALFGADALTLTFPASLTLPTVALTTSTAGLGAGLLSLGAFGAGAALGAVALASRARAGSNRGRREVNNNQIDELERFFKQMEETDTDHCAKLFLCNIASHEKSSLSEEQIAILSLFNSEIPINSARSTFDLAVRLGNMGKDSAVCHKRYNTCDVQDLPLQLKKLL